MQQFISRFADAQATQQVLDKFPRLSELAFEFCTKFNVELEQKPLNAPFTNAVVNVITKSGIPAGSLSVSKDSEGEYFVYRAEHIKKARSSRRTGNDARDASKISVLLKSLVSNDDVPSDARLMEKFKGGVNYAFRQTKTNDTPRISVSSDLAIKMCEHILNINQQNLTNVMDEVHTLYANYTTEMKQRNENNTNHTRFANGSKLIGIHNKTGSDEEKFYLLGEAKYEDEKTVFTTPLVRHASLSEVPELLSDITIIRAYFDSHKTEYGKNNNELGVPRNDRYYADIDISTGYLDREVFWVLIPNTAP